MQNRKERKKKRWGRSE